jgi:hypothetical protein
VLRELGESSLFFSHFEQTAAGPANMLRLPSRAGSHVRKPVRPARIDVRKLHSAYIRSVLLSWHQQKVLLPHRSAIVGCQQRRPPLLPLPRPPPLALPGLPLRVGGSADGCGCRVAAWGVCEWKEGIL